MHNQERDVEYGWMSEGERDVWCTKIRTETYVFERERERERERGDTGDDACVQSIHPCHDPHFSRTSDPQQAACAHWCRNIAIGLFKTFPLHNEGDTIRPWANYVMGELRILLSRFTSTHSDSHFALRKEQQRRDACPCTGYRLTDKKWRLFSL